MFLSWRVISTFFPARRFWIGALVWTMHVAPILPTLEAQETVRVDLASGRSFTGVVDRQTGAEKLVLRMGSESVSIQRSIDWDRVVKATQGERELNHNELKALAKALPAAELPAARVAPARPFHGVFAEPTTTEVIARKALAAAEPHLPVISLSADVFVANWNSDVENDGLVVQLYPLDCQRNLVPSSGTLEVELFAPQLRDTSTAVHSRGMTMTKIGRWTKAVHPDDFSHSGATFELPFQAVHPEFSMRTMPYAMAHVRLSIPGQGVFDTTLDRVRIRPWSPLRDHLWRNEGRRFLPTERTGHPGPSAARAGR